MASSSEAVVATVATATAGASVASSVPPLSVLQEISCAALAAVFAISWLHPIDVVKTRMQLEREAKSYAALVQSMVRSEGRHALYKGLTMAWIAEAVYYGLQLGLYAPLKRSLVQKSRQASGVSTKLLAGALAGSFGAITGNPLVVLRTKMVANVGPRRSIASFVRDVVRDGGRTGFYRGFSAMFLRCVVLSATKMATYDAAKAFVATKFGLEGVGLQFVAALVAGCCLTATVTPFDVIRTRLMAASKAGPLESDEIRGFVACARDIYENHGIAGFYRGARAFWVRIAPKTCLQLVAFEHLKAQAHGDLGWWVATPRRLTLLLSIGVGMAVALSPSLRS